MNRKVLPEDPDLRGVLPALRRAARDAHRLAIQTGTSCYVMRAGKIVDIAARAPVRKRSVRRKITKGTRP
jgi:hypothetical protein